MHSRSFLKLVRIAISPRQAKISCRKSKGIANRRPSLPLPAAFRPQRKVVKRTRNRYTSPCYCCRIQQQGRMGKGRWAAFGRFCHRKCFAANGNQERRGLHGLQLLAFCKTKKGRKGRKQSSNVGHHHTMPPPPSPSPRPFPAPPPSSLVVACTIHVVRN